jgi:hypothetical protein
MQHIPAPPFDDAATFTCQILEARVDVNDLLRGVESRNGDGNRNAVQKSPELLVLECGRELRIGQKLFNLLEVWAIGAHARGLG